MKHHFFVLEDKGWDVPVDVARILASCWPAVVGLSSFVLAWIASWSICCVTFTQHIQQASPCTSLPFVKYGERKIRKFRRGEKGRKGEKKNRTEKLKIESREGFGCGSIKVFGKTLICGRIDDGRSGWERQELVAVSKSLTFSRGQIQKSSRISMDRWRPVAFYKEFGPTVIIDDLCRSWGVLINYR